MSDEYQLRVDVDRLYNKLYDTSSKQFNVVTKDEFEQAIQEILDTVRPEEQDDTNQKNKILALGLPWFEINSDGELTLEESLMTNWHEKFSINSDGELILDDTSNPFSIVDGVLYYDRGV